MGGPHTAGRDPGDFGVGVAGWVGQDALFWSQPVGSWVNISWHLGRGIKLQISAKDAFLVHFSKNFSLCILINYTKMAVSVA